MLAAATWALSTGGCLNVAPPPASGYIGGDYTAPPADAGAAEHADDVAPTDAGSSEAGGALDGAAAAWTGTWAFTSGSEGLLCAGSLAADAVTGTLVITRAASGSGLTIQEDGCSFAFALVGDTASCAPDQPCVAWAVQTIPIWTLTMQPDGTLKEKLGGQVWFDGESCEISGGSTLVRQ
jgi:hypothetical protein